MKTVKSLRKAVKNFVFASTTGSSIFPGAVDQADLDAKFDDVILTAMNNARLEAERTHDWEFSRFSVPVNVGVGLKYNWQAAVEVEEGLTVRPKKITGADSVVEGGYMPLVVDTKRSLDMRLRKLERLYPVGRYPANYDSPWHQLENCVVMDGKYLSLYPVRSEVTTLQLHGYYWLEDYTTDGWCDEEEDDSASDWFIQNGFDYMMWATLVELNYLVQIYVPRQEGSLPPPERLRDRAWESMIRVDADSINGGIMHE
jgi:hypothetical protein